MNNDEIVECFDDVIQTLEDVCPALTADDKKVIEKVMYMIGAVSIAYEEDE